MILLSVSSIVRNRVAMSKCTRLTQIANYRLALNLKDRRIIDGYTRGTPPHHFEILKRMHTIYYNDKHTPDTWIWTTDQSKYIDNNGWEKWILNTKRHT